MLLNVWKFFANLRAPHFLSSFKMCTMVAYLHLAEFPESELVGWQSSSYPKKIAQ